MVFTGAWGGGKRPVHGEVCALVHGEEVRGCGVHWCMGRR